MEKWRRQAPPRYAAFPILAVTTPAFNRLRSELDAIASVGDLQQWGDDNGALIATFRADWQKALRFRYTEKLASYGSLPLRRRRCPPLSAECGALRRSTSYRRPRVPSKPTA